MLFDGGLQSLSSAMEAYHWSSKLQVAALSALAVTLSSGEDSLHIRSLRYKQLDCSPPSPPVPDSRLHVATVHGTLLDLVLCVAENFPNNAPVQQYVCAFHALLLAEG